MLVLKRFWILQRFGSGVFGPGMLTVMLMTTQTVTIHNNTEEPQEKENSLQSP
jgi:hypothetical protein